MANLKESFTKNLTALNVKTNNFIEESKCKTYISTLETEISSLKQTIGECVYNNWISGVEISNGTNEILNSIKEKYEEIEQQKVRILELQEEEKKILGTAQAAQTDAPMGETIFCGQCGAQNASMYKFCAKCGSPLK